MAFDSGSASFTMLELPRPFPDEWAPRFAEHCAPSPDSVGDQKVFGWVTGRHLLDSDITSDSAQFAGWIRLSWREAVRRVPPALLRAECRMAELSRMAAEGKSYLPSKVRREIRDDTAARLLPQMPPQLKAIPFVYRPSSHHLFVSALSDAPLDSFRSALRQAVGFAGSPADPENLAMDIAAVDIASLPGSSFSPDMPDTPMDHFPGREFLTWLWFKSDSENGTVGLESGQSLAVLFEGPLSFAHEGNGAFLTVLKKGTPVHSAEAKTCLLSGKKLVSARITFALDDVRVWTFTLAADRFAVRSLRLPKSDGFLDAPSRFQERMVFLDEWREIFLDLYRLYLSVRTNSRRWSAELRAIREWVAARPDNR